MLRVFKSKQKILGIDITESAIRIVELSRVTANYQITACGQLKASNLDSMNDEQALAQLLTTLVRNLSLTTQEAVIAIPDKLIVRKVIQLSQSFHASEIEAFVLMELEQLFLGVPQSDIAFDFIPLNKPAHQTALMDMLIVAVHKKEVDRRVALLKEAGLKAQIVTLESEALASILQILSCEQLCPPEESIQALVDVHDAFFRFIALKKGAVLFFHEEMFSAYDLPAIGDAITQSLTRFAAAMPFAPLKKLLLAGEHSLKPYLEEKTGLMVHMVSPFSLVRQALDCKVFGSMERSSDYLLPLGLGLML